MDHLKSDSHNNAACVDCTQDPIQSLGYVCEYGTSRKNR
ncbi:hypothetical protein F889_01020 [Acinetobacter colistiniresistens]|uniref:Uncharacterized protein n=1 Tax=Acinetobacter colistiniresistens TaxID=280145 RepID=N9R883_9GAMM|nr:hypothetical protein F889_01020 [Acinetobacter colistiniresistens]